MSKDFIPMYTSFPKNKYGEYYDPVEDTEEYKKAMESIEPRLPLQDGLGSCYKIWYTQKRLLKEEFSIDWKTPDELNPHIIYD